MSGRAPLTSAVAVRLWALALISLICFRAASTIVPRAFLSASPSFARPPFTHSGRRLDPVLSPQVCANKKKYAETQAVFNNFNNLQTGNLRNNPTKTHQNPA
jgi:hypothetical protein